MQADIERVRADSRQIVDLGDGMQKNEFFGALAQAMNFATIQAKAFAILFRRSGEALREGGLIVSRTPVCCCCDSIVADRRCLFRRPFLTSGRTGRRSIRHLRRRGRARGRILSDRAGKGRAFARRLRRGEATRGRTFTDRARWKRCGKIA